MTLIIICIIIIAYSIYRIGTKDGSSNWHFPMWISLFILILHSIELSMVSYDYRLYVNKRDAFIQTLETSRANGYTYETAAIVSSIADRNIELARKKFKNKTFLFDCYIDDRIETLEPIK